MPLHNSEEGSSFYYTCVYSAFGLGPSECDTTYSECVLFLFLKLLLFLLFFFLPSPAYTSLNKMFVVV